MSDPQEQLIVLEQVAAPEPNSFVDGPFGSEMKSSEYSERGVRLIQLQNIGDGYWIDDNKKFIPLEKFETLKRHGAVSGDIIIAKMADPVARSCILPAVTDQFIVVADCIKLTPDPEYFDARFVSAAINSYRTRREAETKSSGTTRLRINLSALKTVHIWAPQLSEQRQIASILNSVDEAIAKTEAVLVKLKQIRAGLLHDLLTRGLDEHGQLRDPSAHPEQFQDSSFGRIPREWEIVRIGNETNIEHGFAFDGRFFSDKPLGPRLLVPGNFHRDGGLYFTDANTKYFAGDYPPNTVLANGDILIVMTDLSPMTLILGRTVLLNEPFKLLHNQRIGKFRFKQPETWNLEFFVALMNDDRLRRKIILEATGTTVRHTSPDRIKSGIGLKPPREEQDRVISAVRVVDSYLQESTTELSKLAALKSGLMADLLTGRVRVPEEIPVAP